MKPMTKEQEKVDLIVDGLSKVYSDLVDASSEVAHVNEDAARQLEDAFRGLFNAMSTLLEDAQLVAPPSPKLVDVSDMSPEWREVFDFAPEGASLVLEAV